MKSRLCHQCLFGAGLTLLGLILGFDVLVRADGPADNVPGKVRPIPPLGIELSVAVRDELNEKAMQIRAAVAAVPHINDADSAEAIVFARAIELATEQSMFYSEAEIQQTRALALMAMRRINTMPASQSLGPFPRWLRNELAAPADTSAQSKETNSKPKLIVGGFQSQIDGSIQPYGLVVPASLKADDPTLMRLDVWLHGRGEQVGEVQFLHQRSTQIGEIAPENTIVLHPFGRYCNAFKFAGEIDVLEAIEHVKRLFPIDGNRINIRGFSMGGAGCWQLAVHYPSLWMAATPGAGFCETREFLKGFQQEVFEPTNYQESMLHWFDCPDWGNNLRHLPTIAYSGELDKQKQAADLMEQTLRERGIKLPHIIGPQTAHKLHPDAKIEIERRLSELAKSGRNKVPREIDFTTFTLRYHESDWVHVEGLEEHWSESRVQAKIEANDSLVVTTQNVSRLTLGPIVDSSIKQIKSINIDGQAIQIGLPSYVTLGNVKLRKVSGQWQRAIIETKTESETLRKRPGLQGPIDDAFMSPFVFVAPNQVDEPTAVDRWVTAELDHAKSEWQRHFRGDVNSRRVAEVSAVDKQTKNLILFGTPQSNPLIAEVVKSLPFAWSMTSVNSQGVRRWPDTCAVIAIYPSPFAADRYVVLNSGFTYREFAYLNNARQIPMLPDWAIVDVSDGATTQLPGKIVEAGFFGEDWQLK